MEQMAGFFWDRGGYTVNQDSAAYEQVILRRHMISMIVVADGIGSLNEGETASGIVIGRTVRWFYTEGAYLMIRSRATHLVHRSIERLLFSIHEDLERCAQRIGGQLGTTYTVLLVTGRKYFCAHIGDSRCMLVNERNRFVDWIRSGRQGHETLGRWITTDDVMEGNLLTKCVGSMKLIDPQWITGKIGVFDKHVRFLVCSDGFYRKTGGNMIADAFSSRSMRTQTQIERSMKTISKTARKYGENDNITAVCLIM